MSPTPPAHHRLAYLDTLRCIAALAVVAQHIGERYFPAVKHLTTYFFQFGDFGVAVFFLCSGFIIPTSLENTGSLSGFWLRRVFRLYPLYLFSIASALVLIKVGLFRTAMPSLSTVLVQLTLLQKFLGKPLILGLYWSLNLEMVFYILISQLFAAALLRFTTSLAVLGLCLAILVGVFIKGGYGLAFYLASMFVGTVIYQYTKQEVTKAKLLGVVFLTLLTIATVTTAALFGKDDPTVGGTHSFIPVVTAWTLAFSTFLLFVFKLNTKQFKLPVYLGTISYSIYLMQGVILEAVHVDASPAVNAALSLALILAVSVATYHLIEKPFIGFGRTLSRKLASSRRVAIEAPSS